MSFTAFAISLAPLWLAIGMVVSIASRRRGHAFFTRWYLGAMLGPLAVPLAIDAVVRERGVGSAAIPLRAKGGGVAVLAGIDGSPASLAAAHTAVALLGDRAQRVTLAAVIDSEADSGVPADGWAQADAALALASESLGVPTQRVIMVGAPVGALANAARDGQYVLLVVDSRGRGASQAALGSVASRLARGVGIPVLLGDTRTTVRNATMHRKLGECGAAAGGR